MIDADYIRRLSDAQGLDFPAEDFAPLAEALTDRLREIHGFLQLEFPIDGSEAHFDVNWNV